MIEYIYLAKSSLDLSSLPKPGADEATFQTAFTIVISITAAISLLFITIGGIRYVLSQGDPQGVAKAKSTIIYALLGLVVAILSQAIVVFVASKV